ncbi:MAG: hypothetical protein HC897_13735, partial [Thermoanaerobaculia bacterium]|nr:hypothetical protein [Thermoanaerobaculia bacterium]
ANPPAANLGPAMEAAPPAPAEGEPAGTDGSGGAIPENLEEMVKERLDAREDSIRRSLEAKKRRLEEELRRAQEANQELEKATQPADAAAPAPDEPPPAPKPDGGGTSEP